MLRVQCSLHICAWVVAQQHRKRRPVYLLNIHVNENDSEYNDNRQTTWIVRVCSGFSLCVFDVLFYSFRFWFDRHRYAVTATPRKRRRQREEQTTNSLFWSIHFKLRHLSSWPLATRYTNFDDICKCQLIPLLDCGVDTYLTLCMARALRFQNM